jgi:hypothetical protein
MNGNDGTTQCRLCSGFHALVNSMMNWFRTPFIAGGSPANWFLWVLVLIVAVWFWQRTLLYIKEEV